jgi:acyl carrier protein
MWNWDAEFEAILRPHLVLLDRDAPVTGDLDLRNAGVDSLALIELLVAIEDAYGVEFPDELLTADTFRTAAALWAATQRLCAEVAAEAVR